ncbi:MAG TPA: hypothetical protein VLL27_05340 [Solirubrobacterales bacterium]|nr:hypothetical protein [Solirubrobacterales bacterium]
MTIEIERAELEGRLAKMAARMGETVEEVVIWILIEECDRAEELTHALEYESGATPR